MDMYTLLYFKWITTKDLLCSTGNSAQCCVAPWVGGVQGTVGTSVRMAESLRCKPETFTALFIGCTLIQSKKFLKSK